MYILAREYGYNNLRPIHRLDKLTSGVCMFARGPHVNNPRQKLLNGPDSSKVYITLVDGEFPEGDVSVDQPLDGFKISGINALAFKETRSKEAGTIFR